MKAILLSLVLVGFVSVAPVYAGGSLDVLGESAYNSEQARINADANVGLSGSTSTADEYSSSASSTTSNAFAGVPSMAWPIALVVLIVAAMSGFIYWYSRKPRA